LTREARAARCASGVPDAIESAFGPLQVQVRGMLAGETDTTGQLHAFLRGVHRADAASPDGDIRCCPWRAGQLAKAITSLQTREIGG
jgi:hypothetical protein